MLDGLLLGKGNFSVFEPHTSVKHECGHINEIPLENFTNLYICKTILWLTSSHENEHKMI